MNSLNDFEKKKLEKEQVEQQQVTSNGQGFDENEQVNTDKMNINQILCNRCGSIILQKMAAHYQHGETSKHLPLPFQKTKHKNELPKNLETEEFNKWWIVGNMFTFENVGFTHSFDGCKFLACADCEIGPIGFVCPDSNNCFVSVERVEYKN
ncbi:unnamed protein product [Meloidogyne enterolobii]|uniref:Uncharacterized protein n=1 Tax=Meloidogyne enterolobii TaxID=390850 RepID=A0ACB0YW79_MELEN